MININVAEPCHESWKGMIPQDGGRHCQACDKVVHDFTTNSKAEIKQVYEAHNGDICGRFHPDMVEQAPIQVASTTTKWMRRFCFSILLAFGTTLFIIGSPKTSAAIAKYRTHLVEHITANGEYKVAGKLTREGSKTPIQYGSVTIVATGEVIEVEEDGTFEIEFGKDAKFIEKNNVKKVEIRVNASGYYSKTITVNLSQSKTQTVDVELERRMIKGKMLMGKPTIHKWPKEN